MAKSLVVTGLHEAGPVCMGTGLTEASYSDTDNSSSSLLTEAGSKEFGAIAAADLLGL